MKNTPTKNIKNIPVVILAGGQGMRLREETAFKPKPMVPIGGKPILWHIMKIYSGYGFDDFIICLGYKGETIKEYFLNYKFMNDDFSVDIGRGETKTLFPRPAEKWRVTLADTGERAMTGARIKKIERYINTPYFFLTYGDGVADIDVAALEKFHLAHGKIATVTGVRPPARFGELSVKDSKVARFSEKPQVADGCINGGFFTLDKKVFDYVSDDDDCSFEGEPMEKLADGGELMCREHDGFWHCMDTARDVNHLEELWRKKKAPWKTWK